MIISEIEIRKMLKNPPFNDFVLLMMQGEKEDSIIRELGRIANRLRSRGLVVMGPVPAPYSRIKNKYRWRIIVRHHKAAELLDLLHTIAD